MAANKIKGEVSFSTTEGETYKLQFTYDALCVLEDAFDKSIEDIAQMMGPQTRMSTWRTLFWAGLLEHQPAMTTKAAGDVIMRLKGAKASELILQAFNRAFPDQEDATGTERPPVTPESPADDGTAPSISESGAS